MNWDESDDIHYIVVNGHQFMGFTRRAIHFTEETEEHELDLITNLKEFEILGDGWSENNETKVWSNGHFNFTKKEVEPTINPQGTKYRFTFTTEKSDEGESQLRFIGGNMEALLAITQESSGNGNPDVNPPTGGTNAGEWILAVDQNGELNLDGQERKGNYTVLFKWGSLLAFSSNTSDLRPVWVSLGFDKKSYEDKIQYLSTITFKQWNYVPYSEGGTITSNEKLGRGDPCEYASKYGYTKGKFRMAKYVGGTYMSEDVDGMSNFNGFSILQNSDIKYSKLPFRKCDNGAYDSSSQGRYWLSTAYGTSAYMLNISSSGVLTKPANAYGFKSHGNAIRCIPLVIHAKLKNESQAIMPREGGTVKIDVRASNTWDAKCFIDGVSVDVAKYVSPVSAKSDVVHKKDITVTIPENKSTEDRKFILQFVNAKMDLKSETIDIIQEGNAGLKPPARGVDASKWILAVDQNGELNLDGQDRIGNYTVLFRWGSLLAFNSYYDGDGIPNNSPFTSVWAPQEYTGLTSFYLTTWRNVPYSNGGIIVKNEGNGTGDPCKYAVKEGYTKGRFRKAKVDEGSMEDFSDFQKGDNNYKATSTLLNEAIVYPYTGYRDKGSDLNNAGKFYPGLNSSNGLYGLNFNGSSTSVSKAEYMMIDPNGYSLYGSEFGAERYGAAIRCIPLMLEAKLVNETLSNVPSAGGTVEIEVRSSDSWEIECSGTGLSSAFVKECLQPSSSQSSISHVEKVLFTIPQNATKSQREFTIQFKNETLDLKSDVIHITQDTPRIFRGMGIPASEWILGMDKNGVLNLDGQERNDNFIVYFKWGSLVALNSVYFSFDEEVIAWLPDGYTYDKSSGWKGVPYVDAKESDLVDSESEALGDPCKYAVKKGYTKGDFRMAKMDEYETGIVIKEGTSDGAFIGGVFYPTSVLRRSEDGGMTSSSTSYRKLGCFWSSTRQGGNSSELDVFEVTYKEEVGITSSKGSATANEGRAIRCVLVK